MSSSDESENTSLTLLRRRRPESVGFRFALGALLLPVFGLVLVAMVLGGGAPLSSWVTLFFALGLEALLLAGGRVRVGWVLAVLVLALVWLSGRAVWASQNPRVHIVTMPDRQPSWASMLVDEHDGVVPTAALLVFGAFLPPIEREELLALLSDGYGRMETDVGPVPTPAVPTWTGRVSWQRFELLSIEPKTSSTVGAVVFLHGDGGNFTLPCWQVSVAAARAGFVTLCPSTSVRANWNDAAGRHIVEETLAEARRRVPVGPVVLAGISAGGVGASAVASSVEDRIAGLLLISGVDEKAQSISRPTLVIQGRQDRLSPAKPTEQWAQATQASYLELQGNHFVLLKRHDEIVPVLVDWLGRLRLPVARTTPP